MLVLVMMVIVIMDIGGSNGVNSVVVTSLEGDHHDGDGTVVVMVTPFSFSSSNFQYIPNPFVK